MKLSARNVLKGKIAAVVKGCDHCPRQDRCWPWHRHHLFHHGRGRQGSKAQKGRRGLCHYQSFGSHCRQRMSSVDRLPNFDTTRGGPEKMFHSMRKSLSVAAVFVVLAWTQVNGTGRRNSSFRGGQPYRCLEGNQRRLSSEIEAHRKIQFWSVQRPGAADRRRRAGGYFLFRRSSANGQSR